MKWDAAVYSNTKKIRLKWNCMLANLKFHHFFFSVNGFEYISDLNPPSSILLLCWVGTSILDFSPTHLVGGFWWSKTWTPNWSRIKSYPFHPSVIISVPGSKCFSIMARKVASSWRLSGQTSRRYLPMSLSIMPTI